MYVQPRADCHAVGLASEVTNYHYCTFTPHCRPGRSAGFSQAPLPAKIKTTFYDFDAKIKVKNFSSITFK